MTIYGGDYYGTATAIYGDPTQLDYDATPFIAVCSEANFVKLTWHPPKGNWTRIRLVRSSKGPPAYEDDGAVLFDRNVGPSSAAPVDVSSYFDTGTATSVGDLAGDRWYNYALYVYGLTTGVGGTNGWIQAAMADVLVVNDHQNIAKMQNLLPSVYTTDPHWAGEGQADAGTQMSRFMSLFGFQADTVRSTYETLLSLHDPSKVPWRVLSLLCAELGVPYEPQLGLTNTRVLLTNAVHIHKTKGTIPGIEAFASSLTGWGTDVVQGINLMLDYNDSSAEEGIGNWWPKALCTLAQAPSSTLTPYVSPTGNLTQGSLALTSTAAGTCQARCGGSRTHGTLRDGVPVTAGQVYSLSGRVNSGLVNNCGLAWFNSKGVFISLSTGTAPITAVTGAWSQLTAVNLTAPAGAYFATVHWTVDATAAAQIAYSDAWQVEKSATASAFQEARQLQVLLDADRINEVTNPSFEVGTTDWSIGATALAFPSTSITRLTSDSADIAGTCCAVVVTPGTNEHEGTTLSVTGLLPLQDYTVSVWIKAISGSPIIIRARDTTNLGAVVESTSVATGAGWVRKSLLITTGVLPATLTIAITTPVTLHVASTFRIDAVLVERGQALRDYFDASTVGAHTGDYFWAGVAHASKSFLYRNYAAKTQRLGELLPDYLWPGMTFSLVLTGAGTGTAAIVVSGGGYGSGLYGAGTYTSVESYDGGTYDGGPYV